MAGCKASPASGKTCSRAARFANNEAMTKSRSETSQGSPGGVMPRRLRVRRARPLGRRTAAQRPPARAAPGFRRRCGPIWRAASSRPGCARRGPKASPGPRPRLSRQASARQRPSLKQGVSRRRRRPRQRASQRPSPSQHAYPPARRRGGCRQGGRSRGAKGDEAGEGSLPNSPPDRTPVRGLTIPPDLSGTTGPGRWFAIVTPRAGVPHLPTAPWYHGFVPSGAARAGNGQKTRGVTRLT